MKSATKVPVVLASVLVLSACAGAGQDSDTNAGESEEVTLQLYHDKPPWEANYEALAAAGLAETGIAIEQTPYADQEAYRAFIRQSFATSEKPDLFTWWAGGQIADLVREGVISPTTDIWSEAVANGDVSESLQTYFTIDGEQYCVPMYSSPWIVYYSKAAFAEQDVSPPTTWSEFESIVEKFKAAGTVPILQADGVFAHAWPGALMAGNAPEEYAALSATGDGSGSFTAPKIEEAIDQWATMLEDGWFGPAGSYAGATEAAAQLQDGSAAMVYFGSWFNGIMQSQGLESGTDYGVFLLPNLDESLNPISVVVEPGLLCSAEGAADQEAVDTYLRWWMTEGAQSVWADERGDFSFNPKVSVADEELNAVSEEMAADDAAQFLKIAELVPVEVNPDMNQAFDGFIANPGDVNSMLEQIESVNASYWAK